MGGYSGKGREGSVVAISCASGFYCSELINVLKIAGRAD